MGISKQIKTTREILDIIALLKEAFYQVKEGDVITDEGWYINKKLILKILDTKI